MSNQGQINQAVQHDEQELLTIIQNLRMEITNIQQTVNCSSLRNVTIRFLQILIERAESKLASIRRTKTKK